MAFGAPAQCPESAQATSRDLLGLAKLQDRSRQIPAGVSSRRPAMSAATCAAPAPDIRLSTHYGRLARERIIPKADIHLSERGSGGHAHLPMITGYKRLRQF